MGWESLDKDLIFLNDSPFKSGECPVQSIFGAVPVRSSQVFQLSLLVFGAGLPREES